MAVNPQSTGPESPGSSMQTKGVPIVRGMAITDKVNYVRAGVLSVVDESPHRATMEQ